MQILRGEVPTLSDSSGHSSHVRRALDSNWSQLSPNQLHPWARRHCSAAAAAQSRHALAKRSCILCIRRHDEPEFRQPGEGLSVRRGEDASWAPGEGKLAFLCIVLDSRQLFLVRCEPDGWTDGLALEGIPDPGRTPEHTGSPLRRLRKMLVRSIYSAATSVLFRCLPLFFLCGWERTERERDDQKENKTTQTIRHILPETNHRSQKRQREPR
ncbi:hypothetical protein CCMA1212_010262 [Trichoderma ghanense]|uniref:Uncharacterized protein n=1 Tax=Trichoderma ghanense TaxID=65468 RepID=A0ABY2GQ92_9HYPO